MDTVWLDVSMWTGLRGTFHPFIDIACEAPDPPPADEGEWQQWAISYLAAVAQQEGWQAGRYAYRAERRDPGGHATRVLTRGQWEWTPLVTS